MQITVATANVMKIPIIFFLSLNLLSLLLWRTRGLAFLFKLTLCKGFSSFYFEVSPMWLATIRTTTESVIINCNIFFTFKFMTRLRVSVLSFFFFAGAKVVPFLDLEKFFDGNGCKTHIYLTKVKAIDFCQISNEFCW